MRSTIWLVVFAACVFADCVNAQQTTHRSLDELIAELGDDDVKFNAVYAVEAIMAYPISPVERLYEALDDPDWQTRQIACDLLWRIRATHVPIDSDNDMVRTSSWRFGRDRDQHVWRKTEIPEVTDRLIAVTIEGFRNDPTPYDHPRKRGLLYTNAVHGMYRMMPIAHQWRDELEIAMESDDAQQRLVAAIVLARAGVVQSIDQVCEILLPHLRDNDIREDAKHCLWALAGYGTELIPILEEALAQADDQQADLIRLLILDLVDPPATKAEKIDRSMYNSITHNVYDPVADPPREPNWWWFRYLYN